MTINEVLALLDELKPNQYDVKQKVQWLSTVDGLLVHEVMAGHEGVEVTPETYKGYDPETDMETVLLAPAPYDELYTHYLMAQVDYLNGEMDRYNNAMVMYNMALSRYTDWYNRGHSARHGPGDCAGGQPAGKRQRLL